MYLPKFKAWDIEEGCWIPEELIAVDAMGEGILTYDENEDRWIAETIPFKLVQFTGLKDKNGVEIYRGYIVKASGEEPLEAGSMTLEYNWQFQGEVRERSCQWEIFDKEGDYLPLHDCIEAHIDIEIEVIGNIFENADLIK
jgi:uncharacterized phage protein (TIGR01671 family)